MRALVGIVCDAAGVAPATMRAVVDGLRALWRGGHDADMEIKPSAGQPDIARCLFAGQALAGQFDVLVLVDSGAYCAGPGLADLAEAAALRGAIVGTLTQPVLEEGGAFKAVSSSLTAYSRVALSAVAEAAPKVQQGVPAVFLPRVEGGRLIPGGWSFCFDHRKATGLPPEVLVDVRCGWAMPAEPKGKWPGVPVRQVSYPRPQLPVGRYLAELDKVAERLRPDGQRASLTEPPPAIEMPAHVRPGRIRVALVNTCMLAGGAERQTCTLAAGLAKRDRYEVAVINANPDQGVHPPLLAMLEAARVPCYGGDDHPSIDGADVVLWWGPALRRRIGSRGLARPTIHVAHSDSHWTAAAIDECRAFISEVVGVSGPAAAMAADVLGRPRESVPVVWNGIDPAEFASVTRRPRDGSFVVGWLGRLSDEKNPIAVLRAVRLLNPGARLEMWGDGPLRGFVEEVVADMADRIVLHGTIEDRAAAFSQMDVVVLASLFEGLPLTVIEAMLAGVPVIAPPHGDLPLVLRGRGFLADPNVASIAGVLEDVRVLSRGELDSRTDAARAFALEHFSVARMTNDYAALIEGLACRC